MARFRKHPSPFSPSNFFPDPNEADSHGLLGIGGELRPDWLLDAYIHGIFPWPFEHYTSDEHVLGWFSPDPRCIFEFDHFHISRRLKQTCRSGRFQMTSDRAFESVMRNCATVSGRENETWITPAMIDAFTEFHRLGFAHSVEAWLDDRLVGGVYGVAIQGLFAAESMFFLERDASKVALVALVEHLKRQGFLLMDIQVLTNHTSRFGAVEIDREEYLKRLHQALKQDIEFGVVSA